MRTPSTLFALAALGVGGCATAEVDQLGWYEVEATRQESCAETGLLAAPETYTMRVYLQGLSESGILWDDGTQRLQGLRQGNRFELGHLLVVDMREGLDESMPCRIERALRIEGEIDDSGDEEQLAGTLDLVYTPVTGSVCDDLLTGPEPLADTLPCTVAFELEGPRRR